MYLWDIHPAKEQKKPTQLLNKLSSLFSSSTFEQVSFVFVLYIECYIIVTRTATITISYTLFLI